MIKRTSSINLDYKTKVEGSVTNIILTTGHPQDDMPDYKNLYTDVIVQFDSGEKYYAPFITYKALEIMVDEMYHIEQHKTPYKVLNVVLIRDFNNGDLMPIIESMLAEGDFQLVFKKM